MSLRSGLLAALTALALLVAPTAAAEPVVEPPTVAPAGTLIVTGDARVGTMLVAAGPGWVPEDAATSYQWLRDDLAIPGADATDETYTPTVDDFDAAISVRATGTKEGFAPGEAISERTGPVVRGILTAVEPPSITGEPRVGSTLSASPPVWNEAGVANSYRWLRGTRIVSTTRQYELKAADVDARILVRVTGTKDGYDTASADSVATATVTKIPATVTVRGSSPKVGVLKLAIRVSAAEAVTGTVSIRQGTKLLKSGLKLTSGGVTYTRSGIKPGRYTYSVRYAGTTRIASSTGSAAVRIKAKTTPSISLKPTTSIGKVRIGIAVTAAGQPPLGGTAYVKEGRKTLKTTIKVVRGKATFSASAKPGRHTYLVGYRGTSQVRSGTKSVTVKVPAPAKLVRYPNCTALNKVHPHGVGRSNAKDKVSGSSEPVTTFLRNTRLYELNTGRDRDKDGIACEKR